MTEQSLTSRRINEPLHLSRSDGPAKSMDHLMKIMLVDCEPGRLKDAVVLVPLLRIITRLGVLLINEGRI
jgi:hypothetical protein